MAYRIEYSPEAMDHLKELSANQRRQVLDVVDAQLIHEPEQPTRNRKRMRPNPLAEWELRVGDLRVYYKVQGPPAAWVVVGAIGRKKGNQVFIGGQEVIL